MVVLGTVAIWLFIIIIVGAFLLFEPDRGVSNYDISQQETNERDNGIYNHI